MACEESAAGKAGPFRRMRLAQTVGACSLRCSPAVIRVIPSVAAHNDASVSRNPMPKPSEHPIASLVAPPAMGRGVGAILQGPSARTRAKTKRTPRAHPGRANEQEARWIVTVFMHKDASAELAKRCVSLPFQRLRQTREGSTWSRYSRSRSGGAHGAARL